MSRVRVLVVDDSAAARETIATLLREDAALEVVGEASSGEEAVARARELRPQVITMDALMPGLDGIGAIGRILEEAPTRIVVVSAAAGDSSQGLAFRALAAGALDIVAKPQGGGPEGVRSWGRKLAETVRLMSEVPVIRRFRRAAPTSAAPGAVGSVEAVGLVASTGGPPVLASILGALPADLGCAVLVAQHVAPGFTAGLVRWLRESTALRVEVAASGSACAAGTVYLPPDGCDLLLGERGDLAVPPSAGGFCPSGDRLLESLARVRGRRAGGAVLTGMGDDGARGLLALRRAGGPTFAQDPATAVLPSMPEAARALGAAGALLAPLDLAAAIGDIAGRQSADSP